MWARLSDTLIAEISSQEIKNPTLSFSNQKIESDKIPSLVEALNNNPNIKHVCFATTELNDDDACLLANCKYVEELDLDQNELTDKGAMALAKNENFRRLHLNLNMINDKGGIALAESKTLTYLDVSENGLSNKTAEVLLKNNTLKTLIITGNRDVDKSMYQQLRLKFNKTDIVAKAVKSEAKVSEKVYSDGSPAVLFRTSSEKGNLPGEEKKESKSFNP